jgi:L-alanine-DL-glutamate epimerase-like enolase superfamily enzyme
MKIREIEAFQVAWAPSDTPAQRSAFVRVHTDDGLSGIGEASPMQGGVASLGIVARDLAPLLIGQDPFDHAVLQDRLLHRFVKLGPEGALTGALAAVDIALWDLKGKSLGQPIYKLLGGAWRTELPFYASIGGNGERALDDVVRIVEQRLNDRPAAVKIRFDNDRTRLDADIPAPRRKRCGGWSVTASRSRSTRITATRSAARFASAGHWRNSATGGSRSRSSITTSGRWARWRAVSTSRSRPASKPIRCRGWPI